jgi:hypothetical protein
VVLLVGRVIGAGGGLGGCCVLEQLQISGPLSIPITVGPGGPAPAPSSTPTGEILVQMGQIQPLDLLPTHLPHHHWKVVAVEEEMLQMEAGATGGSGGGQTQGPGS